MEVRDDKLIIAIILVGMAAIIAALVLLDGRL